MAILLPVLIAMVALAVELGRMYLVRSQLQSAVDAGALAAALQLREDPDNIEAALAAGKDFVQRNRVGTFVTVPEEAIIIQDGKWNAVTRSFSGGVSNPDAIQVSGTLSREPLFWGKAIGFSTFAVPRSAIAIGGGSPLDIVMALDLSGSMSAQGRLNALLNAAPTFVNVLEEVGDNDRIGVMGYGALIGSYDSAASGHSGVAYTNAPASMYPPNDDWCAVLEAPLTNNYDYLRGSVLTAGTLIANKYNGWTPVGAAIRDSTHYLVSNARARVEKVIVLMSDGHANKPNGNGPGYALQQAAYAASVNIKVYTISLGNAADENLMQQIADATGGEHFIASGSAPELAARLTEAFEKIVDAIKQTQMVQ